MPELPEVETTLRGIRPYLEQQQIESVVVRNANLRWPVPIDLLQTLHGKDVGELSRRAKYLLIAVGDKTLLLHLGMSGSLRVVAHNVPPGKHDHIDLRLTSGNTIRFNDPRRFGCYLVASTAELSQHPLLLTLGVEPLGEEFTADYLFRCSRRRKSSIKNFIMNAKIVVGVGNIYASESLFAAGIRPTTAAGRVSRKRYTRLVEAIVAVLEAAIGQGGTSLKDFQQVDGRPGYFTQQLNVYARAGCACFHCERPIKRIVLGQRSSFYCPKCQR